MTHSTDAGFPIARPQILFELARGGMGSVHLARVAGLGGFERFVVVKRLLALVEEDTEGRARFLSEARLAARVHHANVVGTHHVGHDSSGLFMVLDYVEGSSLQGLVDRAGLRSQRIEVPLVLRIVLDALAGLGAIHRATDERGRPLEVVHRDVSLQNVLVGRDGIARIADFGIAKEARPSVATKAGLLVGKLLYLPPEYIRQEHVDATADIYMLGVTLWCAITGEEPWVAENGAQLMHRILGERVPSLASRLNAPVAEEIEALVARACDPDPRKRFQTADEMAEVIHALDRERGWVANQREVAELVETLVGVDLDRRREHIVALSSALAVPVVDETRSQHGDAVPITAERPAVDSHTGHALSRHWWAVVMVAVLGGVAVVALALPTGPSDDDTRATVASADAADRSEAMAVAVDSTQVETQAPTPSTPSSGGEQAIPSAQSVEASSAEPRPEPPAASSSRSGQKSTRTPKQPPASPLRPPDEISTKNPYR